MRQLTAIAIVLLVCAAPVQAQLAGPVTINTVDAGSCVTANACAVFGMGSNTSLTIDIQGTFSGTLTFDGTIDGTLWRTIPVIAWTDFSLVTTSSSAQAFTVPNDGIGAVRVRATSWSSGTATIFARRGYAHGRAAVVPQLFDTSNFIRSRGTGLSSYHTAGTLTSSNENGRVITEKGPRWSILSTPAVSTRATVTIAAEPGVRHIADTVCFSAGATAAPTATALLVNLRDGASDAGTIIGSWRVVIPAAAGNVQPPVCFGGLNLTGTTNTAMTIEWSALLTNLFEAVSLMGWHTF